MDRRQFLLGAAALAASAPARAGAVKELRIGYQKTAILLAVKGQKLLEQHFEPKGISI